MAETPAGNTCREFRRIVRPFFVLSKLKRAGKPPQGFLPLTDPRPAALHESGNLLAAAVFIEILFQNMFCRKNRSGDYYGPDAYDRLPDAAA